MVVTIGAFLLGATSFWSSSTTSLQTAATRQDRRHQPVGRRRPWSGRSPRRRRSTTSRTSRSSPHRDPLWDEKYGRARAHGGRIASQDRDRRRRSSAGVPDVDGAEAPDAADAAHPHAEPVVLSADRVRSGLLPRCDRPVCSTTRACRLPVDLPSWRPRPDHLVVGVYGWSSSLPRSAALWRGRSSQRDTDVVGRATVSSRLVALTRLTADACSDSRLGGANGAAPPRSAPVERARRLGTMATTGTGIRIIRRTSTGLDNRKLLMWLFLASDCMFFGSLIATYMIYRGRAEHRSGSAAVPARDLRHPLHLGQRLRAPDVLADDGAGAGGDPAGRPPRAAHLADRDRAARARSSSAASSSSSRPSTTRA